MDLEQLVEKAIVESVLENNPDMAKSIRSLVEKGQTPDQIEIFVDSISPQNSSMPYYARVFAERCVQEQKDKEAQDAR